MSDAENKQPSTATRIVGILVAAMTAFGVREGIRIYRERQDHADLVKRIGGDPGSGDRIAALMQAELLPVMSSPAFKAYFNREYAAAKAKNPSLDQRAFGEAVGRSTVGRGIARLPDEGLQAIHRLKTKMAFASERACPCYWDTGGCSQADIVDGLGRLSTDELKVWMRMSAQAAQLEIAAGSPVPDTSSDFEDGLAAVLRGLTPTNRERLIKTFKTQPASRLDQCWAVQTLFREADSLPPESNIKFVRALANLTAS